MKNRCILIYPKIEGSGMIQEIRERYDPAVHKIAPHITLVFPFESDIGTPDLKKHLVKALSGVKPFRVTLSGITGDPTFGKYLFLNIHRGKSRIIGIHKKLYTGILKEFLPAWLEDGRFLPHMTVGEIGDEEKFALAIEATKNITDSFHTTVDTVSVEIIEENGDSTIELQVALKK